MLFLEDGGASSGRGGLGGGVVAASAEREISKMDTLNEQEGHNIGGLNKLRLSQRDEPMKVR